MAALFKPNLALTEPERKNCWDKALIKVSSGRLILITQQAPAQRHELTGLAHGWKASFWSREAQMIANGVVTTAAFDFLFKFQNWKQITPMTLSGGDKSLRLTFIPNWFSHLLCKIRVNARTGFQTFFFKSPLSCLWQRQRLKTGRDDCSELLLTPHGWTGLTIQPIILIH